MDQLTDDTTYRIACTSDSKSRLIVNRISLEGDENNVDWG